MADINNANVDTLVDIASKTAVSVISAVLDENCNEHQLRELLEAEMAVTIKEQIEQKKLLRQLQLAELQYQPLSQLESPVPEVLIQRLMLC